MTYTNQIFKNDEYGLHILIQCGRILLQKYSGPIAKRYRTKKDNLQGLSWDHTLAQQEDMVL